MRKLIFLILLGAIISVAGCSAVSDLTTPADRMGQSVVTGRSPALAFQLNVFLALGGPPRNRYTPLDVPLRALGLTKIQALKILSGGSLVNATCAPQDVDVPEWDEWLLATAMDVDVPEWDEWLLGMTMDVDVPEWDEWLLRFGNMPKYRSTNWMDWAVRGPIKIVDVDIPEWDEWLLNLTLRQIARSYDAWWRMPAAIHPM